jgi:hypothetical protein
MTDFTRNYASVNLEGTTDEVLEISLKFKDGYAITWEKNADNTLKFERVKRRLSFMPRIFFKKED